MRLIKAEINGFGRLSQGTINLDSKVLAVVGPNEAGKTTLLKALAYVHDDSSLPIPARSRGQDVPDEATVVRLLHVLDEADVAALGDLDLNDPPRSIWLERTAGGGNVRVEIEPPPLKSFVTLERIVNALNKTATNKQLHLLPTHPVDDELSEDPEENLRGRFKKLAALLADALSQGDREAVFALEDEAESLQTTLEEVGVDGELPAALEKVVEWNQRADPSQEVTNRLFARAPRVLLFSDEDRTLKSSYALTAEFVEEPPAALRNLTAMAGLDLEVLFRAIQVADEGRSETLILQANHTLQEKFAAAWKQSDLTAYFKTSGSTLTVMIKQDGHRITAYDERSAGLRMFVAVIAFLAARGTMRPPVLLIDEAETHLHMDAQADLVSTFMSQQQAGKIIYTTHSPACLPPDLGSNIRAVLPDKNHGDRSTIEGSFWHRAAGYSPLMLAMGAGAAAFTSARFVVLSEGASEMLLLPSLIRGAIKVDDLLYQIAPGLAEVHSSLYPELDLEGARVAYLVDGDPGGLERRKALIAGGIPENRIVVVEAQTLENLLASDSYLTVIRILLGECNPGVTIPDLPKLPPPDTEPWPNVLQLWAEEHSLKMPGKRVVASRLVEEGHAVASKIGSVALKKAHGELMAIFRPSK